MKYNKSGEMFFYEDKMFIVGEEVYATECDYAGLLEESRRYGQARIVTQKTKDPISIAASILRYSSRMQHCFQK